MSELYSVNNATYTLSDIERIAINALNSEESIKAAIFNSVAELTTLESNARNNEEDYEQTLNRLHAEGFLDGLQWALALVERANLTNPKGE